MTPKRQSGKRTVKVKAWALLTKEDEFLMEVKKYWRKPTVKVFFPLFSPRGKYTVVPCTISYALPAKDKQKKL